MSDTQQTTRAAEGRSAFEVRPATAADDELLARLGAETFYDSFVNDNTPEDMAAYLAKSFSREIQARELSDSNSLFLIAEHSSADRSPAAREQGTPSALYGEARPAVGAATHLSDVTREDGDDAVGYARLVWGSAPAGVVGSRPIEVNRFYIRRPWIGAGAATALMRRCLEEAERLESDVIWLGVWEHNDRARAFYRKWGFVDVGSHDFVLGTDVQTDIVMARS